MVKREEWISVQEARHIISENSGHDISADYVRLMAHKGRIGWKKLDGRTNVYNRKNVEAIRVRPKKTGEAIKPAA